MFFKRLRISLLPVLFLSACGLKLGENPSSPQPLVLTGTDVGCLENAPETLLGYFDAKATDADVLKVFDCADKALDTFASKTSGAQAGLYTRGELENFLVRYFLNGRKLGNSFYESAFEFKVAIIGGDSKQLTRKELVQAREFLQLLKSQVLSLRPLLPLTDLVGQRRSFADFDLASQIFADIGSQIGTFLEKTGDGYTFAQMDRALLEIGKLLPNLSVNRYRESIELLKLWKTTFVSPSTDEISKREWSRILRQGAQWYFLSAKYEQLGVNTSSYLCGEGRDRAFQLLKETTEIMEQSLALKGTAMISFHELDQFIDLIPDAAISMRKATMKDLVRTLTQKIFHNLHTKTLLSASLMASDPGITSVDLRGLLALVRDWNMGQSAIENIFSNKSLGCDSARRWDKQFSGVLVSRADLGKGFDDFARSRLLSPEAQKKLNSIRSYLSTAAPLWEADSPTIALGRSSRAGYSYLELSARNTFIAALGAAYEGYGHERLSDGRVTRLAKAELQEIYLDIRPAGIELKLMDPRLWNWSDYRFREANIFTATGNGDDRVSLAEFTDLAIELISAKGMANELHAESAKICKSLGNDIFGQPVVEEKCFFMYLRTRLGDSAMKAPAWLAYYRALSNTDKDAVVSYFRKLILPANKAGVEISYMELFGGVFHFEELIMERYDADRSDGIDADEALLMLPQFKSVLKEASGLETDADLEAVLTYTLAKGETPTRTLFGAIGFMWWKTSRPLWDFQAPRMNLIKVFSAFVASPYQ